MLVRAQRSIALVLGLFGCELDVKDTESDSRTEIAEQKPAVESSDQSATELDIDQAIALVDEVELPACHSRFMNRIFYVINDQAYQFCDGKKWQKLDDRHLGDSKSKISKDLDFERLIEIEDIPRGRASCSDGGVVFRLGVDLNRNEKLERREFFAKRFACHSDLETDRWNGAFARLHFPQRRGRHSSTQAGRQNDTSNT
jgi:hypothetical protein